MTVFYQQTQTVTGNQFNAKDIPVPQPASDNQELMFALNHVKRQLDFLKPNDRSPVDRHFAVAINDLEHLIAYVSCYITTDTKE